MDLAARIGNLRTRPGPRDAAMRAARVCYVHLGGAAGVRLLDALIAQNLVLVAPEGLSLFPASRARFVAAGIDVEAIQRKEKTICRTCLDWSERRSHLAGPLAKAFLDMFLARGWIHRETGGRAIRFSAAGQAAFEAFIAAQTPRQNQRSINGLVLLEKAR